MAATTTIAIQMLALALLSIQAESSLPLNPMRAAKCLVPNGIEHIGRAALLQQCISENYGQGNETKCYDELGCFPMGYPWTSALRPFPTPFHPSEVNVRMYCYTRDSTKRHNITLWPQVKLNGCPFSPSKKAVFVTHGFIQNANLTWLSDLKDNYLRAEDANIFLVDWGQGAEVLSYLQGASNTRIAGAEIGRFIRFLEVNHGLKPTNVHLIGHSLGAQVMSYAAKGVKGIGHFTALEPAQPGFEGTDSQVRVDKTDADFVEVVHTNAAPFIPNLGFGMITPHGDVDFYVNGGVQQPGCPLPDHMPEIKSIKDLASIPAEALYQLVFCSHTRAYEYYIRVLDRNCIIWGRSASFARHLINAGTMGLTESVFSKTKKCDAESCIPLGLNTPHSKARGSFAATTHVLPPFCETNPEENSKLLSEIEESNGGKFEKTTNTAKKTMDQITSGILGHIPK